MSSSNSTNFATSAGEIVKYAFLNVGAIGEGETPNPTQLANGYYFLNLITKAWNSDGMPLWAIRTATITLIASNSYTIGIGGTPSVPRPQRIHSAFIRDTSVTPNTDVKMNIITAQEYDDISSKSITGSPISLFYDPKGAQGSLLATIYIWPKPDATAIANKQITIRYQRPYEDFDSSTDEPDFPQEWYMALVWYLSWAIAPQFGVPLDERTKWLMEAEMLKQKALESGMEEGSIYFNPSSRRMM